MNNILHKTSTCNSCRKSTCYRLAIKMRKVERIVQNKTSLQYVGKKWKSHSQYTVLYTVLRVHPNFYYFLLIERQIYATEYAVYEYLHSSIEWQ
jgi:hypothetical protein